LKVGGFAKKKFERIVYKVNLPSKTQIFTCSLLVVHVALNKDIIK
jgi:hypothetical protein